MKKFLHHIPAVLSAVVMIFASCSRDDAEVIPRAKLAKIYAEMLMTDQWILTTPSVRTIADTSLVYEPILEKYGYDSDDYRKTVDEYMNDPERFGRIFRESGEILEKRLRHLRKEQERLNMLKAREKEAQKYKTNFKPEEFFPYIFNEPYVHYYDSVAFVPDSTLMVYRLVSLETSDTTYSGIEMMVKSDTLKVCDSLALADTVVKPDTIIHIKEPSDVGKELVMQPTAEPALKPRPLRNEDKKGMMSTRKLPEEGMVIEKNLLK